MQDWQFRRRRQRLVALLREKGITDERVLAALGTVPRHAFVDSGFIQRAYEDEALPIGRKQTISQPFTVAYQTQMLAPAPGAKVLEIGTGSGYQGAILCELGVRLFSIERHRYLHDRAKRILADLGYRPLLRYGDGMKGWAALAPFDGILVTAGATDIPKPLLQQLRVPTDDQPGGTLVIPVGDQDGGQRMHRITRTGEDTYETERTHNFRFVPLLPGEQ